MAGSKVDLKVVLLGKSYAGKTSLVERYIHDRFSGDVVPYQNVMTIGAAFGAKKIDVNGKPLVMGIWDTAGSERYEAMSRIYYRGARAAVLCYDLTDKSSFDRVRFWIGELRVHEEKCKIYLCGTKKDLVDEDATMRKVNQRAAKALADDCMAELYETSSKSGESISKLGLYTLPKKKLDSGELFMQIAKDFLEKMSEEAAQGPGPGPGNTFMLGETKKSSCVCKGS